MTTTALDARELRRVVLAAAVGNVIEWYDFYIFGSLATILSVQFFEKSNPVAALLSTVALFTVGFLIRPLGALLFGRIGDLVGRKYTFLLTLGGMGISTALIGVVPGYASIGIAAAIILFGLRVIQAVPGRGIRRGDHLRRRARLGRKAWLLHGWLQTSPTLASWWSWP